MSKESQLRAEIARLSESLKYQKELSQNTRERILKLNEESTKAETVLAQIIKELKAKGAHKLHIAQAEHTLAHVRQARIEAQEAAGNE